MSASMPAVEPTNSTAAPRARKLSATQSAGIACPPVPPPAIKTRDAPWVASRGFKRFGLTYSLTVLRYAVEDSHGDEADDSARAAVADKRERYPGQGHSAHGRPHVEGSLDGEHGGETRRYAPAHYRRGVQGDPEPREHEKREGYDYCYHPQKAELLADKGEDHVRLHFRNGDDLLSRPDPGPEEAARLYGDHGLHELVPGALRDAPRVEEGHKTIAPVRG